MRRTTPADAMAGALPTLFRYSWGFAATSLGVLASTMAGVAFGFRRIAHPAVHGTGTCSPEALVDGVDVYCRLGIALGHIAGGLNIGAIVVAAAAFFAAWQWWHARARAEATTDFRENAGAGDADGGGGDGGD